MLGHQVLSPANLFPYIYIISGGQAVALGQELVSGPYRSAVLWNVSLMIRFSCGIAPHRFCRNLDNLDNVPLLTQQLVARRLSKTG